MAGNDADAVAVIREILEIIAACKIFGLDESKSPGISRALGSAVSDFAGSSDVLGAAEEIGGGEQVVGNVLAGLFR